jgi:hypothetical protein
METERREGWRRERIKGKWNWRNKYGSAMKLLDEECNCKFRASWLGI